MHEKMWNDLKRELHLRIDNTNEDIGKSLCVYFLNLMARIESSAENVEHGKQHKKS